MVSADLIEQWCRYSPSDRDELLKMSREGLQMIMAPRIAFGTSGLRAEMGPGFARMNRVTVQIAAAVHDFIIDVLVYCRVCAKKECQKGGHWI